uniref:Uncharacterized protein n=1 Tax=Caenorhabditis japonica TaxID=281687 RepID=A0A8R1HNN6_CAEJA
MMANINLKIIIVSYFMAGLSMSIARLCWLICDLLWVPIETMEIFMYLRLVFQTSVSAHLAVFSAERSIATCRSKRYEQNSGAPLILFGCFLTYPYSFFQLYSKYHFANGREINVIMIAVLSLLSFLITTIVLVANKKKVKERRFKGPISEAYQMRENIRTSRLLLQVFITAAIMVGASCYFLLRFSASLKDPTKTWTTIINGFIYDMLVSIGTTCTTFIFLSYLVPGDKKTFLLHILHLSHRRKQVAPSTKRASFRSIHGVDVEIGSKTAEEEARVYFTQLSAAWKV